VRTTRLSVGLCLVLAAAGCDRATDESGAAPKAAVSKAPESAKAEPVKAEPVKAEPEPAPPPDAVAPKAEGPPAEPATLLATFERSPPELVVRAIDGKGASEVLRMPLAGRAVARLWSDSHGLVVVLDGPPALVTVNQGTVTRHAAVEWGLDSSLAELADGRVVHREFADTADTADTADATLLAAPRDHRAVERPAPYLEKAPTGFALEVTEVSETKLDLACRSPQGAITIPNEGREGAVLSASARWLARAPGIFLLERELDWTEVVETDSVLMRACDAEPLSTDPDFVWGPDHWWAFGDGKQWSVREGSTERLRLPQGSGQFAEPVFVGAAILGS